MLKSASSKRAPSDGEAFARHLTLVRDKVDKKLRARWDAKLRRRSGHGPEVNAMLSAARDLTLRGGKRFRAALLVATYAGVAPEAPTDVAFDAGASLELLQTYLLIQDDWIDGDRLRRGGPSVHAALEGALGSAHLGEASALLASDLTWGFALEIMAGLKVDPAIAVATIALLTQIHEDVVIGQQLDVLGSASDVEAMHALKTGSYTVRGPILLGATLASANEATKRALDRYSSPLGVAFQLRDDLLGTFGTEAETGKPEGGDLRAGKRTAVIAEAENRLDSLGKAALARVFGKARASRKNIAAAMRALEACGARSAVADRLATLCDRAEKTARALPIAPASRAIFAGAAAALRMPREGSGTGSLPPPKAQRSRKAGA